MSGRMQHEAHRKRALARVMEPHVASINGLVDQLRERKRGVLVPYVDAEYGGCRASVLLVFQDPGPKTDPRRQGSGLLSAQNDDPSAKRLLRLLGESGFGVSDVVTWNIWPWYKENQKPGLTAGMLDEGGAVLLRLLDLLPDLRVVMLMGKQAREGWARLVKRHPHLESRCVAIESLHTSQRGILDGHRHKRVADGEARILSDLQQAKEIVSVGVASAAPAGEREPGGHR